MERKKEYLKSYQEAIRKEAVLAEEIQRLCGKEQFMNDVEMWLPEGVSYEDQLEFREKLDLVLEELKEQRCETITLYGDIRHKIKQMDDETQKELLTRRYLQGKTWEKVAEEMNYSWQWIHKLHRMALSNFRM